MYGNGRLCSFSLRGHAHRRGGSGVCGNRIAHIRPSLRTIFIRCNSRHRNFLPVHRVSTRCLDNGPHSRGVGGLVGRNSRLVIRIRGRRHNGGNTTLSACISLTKHCLMLVPGGPHNNNVSHRVSNGLHRSVGHVLNKLSLPGNVDIVVHATNVNGARRSLRRSLGRLLGV